MNMFFSLVCKHVQINGRLVGRGLGGIWGWWKYKRYDTVKRGNLVPNIKKLLYTPLFYDIFPFFDYSAGYTEVGKTKNLVH